MKSSKPIKKLIKAFSRVFPP